jgi:hypothetical protein
LALFRYCGKRWRHDTQQNDTQHNDIQHNKTQQCDIQRNKTQHSDIQNNDTLNKTEKLAHYAEWHYAVYDE